MNILIINSSKTPGGIESHSVTLASALLKKKQTVYLACPAGSLVEKNAMTYSVPVIDFSLTNSADIRAIFRLRSILRATSADALIVNLEKD